MYDLQESKEKLFAVGVSIDPKIYISAAIINLLEWAHE